MRISRPLAAAAFLACAWGAQARVDSAFFVQLGTVSSESDAEEKWDKLKSDYPALLGKLPFAARSVTPVGGGAAEYRLQAGPAQSRDAARRICTQLQVKNIECFIVETAVFNGAPSLPAATAAATPEQLAALGPEEALAAKMEAAAAAAALPAPEPTPALAPSASEASAPVSVSAPVAVAAIPEAAPAPAGHVEVAEAVAVSPSAPPVDTAAPHRAEPFRGWVTIGSFTNEQAAYDFYEVVAKKLGSKIGARVRVTRRLLPNAVRSGAVLSLGSIRDQDSVAAVCALAAEKDATLICAREAENSPTESAPGAAQPGAIHSTELSAPGAKPVREIGLSPVQFWVQLGSWKNEAEALDKFKQFQEKTSDTLSGYTPQVSAPAHAGLGAPERVRLRVGPFPVRSQADKLCATLRAKDVRCITVPEKQK